MYLGSSLTLKFVAMRGIEWGMRDPRRRLAVCTTIEIDDKLDEIELLIGSANFVNAVRQTGQCTSFQEVCIESFDIEPLRIFCHAEQTESSPNRGRLPCFSGANCRNSGSRNPEPDLQSSASKVEMTKLEYKDIQQVLSTLEIDDLEEQPSHGSTNIEFTAEEAVSILKEAVSAYFVSKTIQKMSKTADFSGRNIFFTSFMAMIQGVCNRHQSKIESNPMESLLTSWNLKRVPIPGNGNCLFRSVAFSLVQRIQGGDLFIAEHLQALGVPESHIQDVHYLSNLLRVRMVEEWNVNHDDYQGFVTVDITTVTHEYLQSGHFSVNVGDLMVANILQMPITIFTSVPNMPILCIMPTTQMTVTAQPIFLAYTQSGPGHYDSVVSVSTEQTSRPKRPTKCTCGRKSTISAACQSLRCASVRDKKECTTLCTCKGCSNTFGIRPPPSSTRRRSSYDNQRQPLRGKTSDEFMKETGELLTTDGHLTTLEVLLLKSIIIYFILHGFLRSQCPMYTMYTIRYAMFVTSVILLISQYLSAALSVLSNSYEIHLVRFIY